MIRRTYQCPDCFHRWEVECEWDAPVPSCAACDAREVNQEFRVNVGGSNASRAVALTEKIMREDYGVANYHGDNREGGVGKTAYSDQSPAVTSTWAGNMLQEAISIGRKTRMEGGSGLDILQRNLASGAQPDLIEVSKRRALKVY